MTPPAVPTADSGPLSVFVIPIGRGQYELYLERDPAVADEPVPSGVVGRMRARFTALLREAEDREHGQSAPAAGAWWGSRLQTRLIEWVAHRVAEQRLLWNLRSAARAVAVHPTALTAETVSDLVMTTLRRDRDRHRWWLVIDAIGLAVSGLVAIVPGPNLLAYFFVFRVVGHWLSIAGARQGLRHTTWSAESSAWLDALEAALDLEPDLRAARVHEVADALRLPRLPRFVTRLTAGAA